MENIKNTFQRIEKWRDLKLKNMEKLNDGSLGIPGPFDEGSISDACKVSKRKAQCEQLALMVTATKPYCSIELGTNIGISGAYIGASMLKSSMPGAKFHTIEASPYRQRLARELHSELTLENVVYHTGLFYDALPIVLSGLSAPIDLAFIDGQHQYKPTLDFFSSIYPFSSRKALFIFDDIEWSEGMKNAWNAICEDKRIDMFCQIDGVGYAVRD